MKNSIFAEGAGYVGGRFVPIAEAVLPVTDWGFTRSDAVYDVVHVFSPRLTHDAYPKMVTMWIQELATVPDCAIRHSPLSPAFQGA